jgi:hypothetical protein
MPRLFGKLLLIVSVFIVLACSDNDEVNRNSIDYFEARLQKDMSHERLMIVFGKPDKDLGSGIHIYVYKLDDTTEVWVGISDKILYANHMDKDQNLLKVLI